MIPSVWSIQAIGNNKLAILCCPFSF